MAESRTAADPGTSQPGSALPLEAFYQDARDTSPESFEQKHGASFLLATAAALGRRKGTSNTELLLAGAEGDPAGHTANLATVVYPLRRRPGAEGHIVTIGRDAQHDVVVPDPSVSRFHAFGKAAPDGGFVIHDAESTNGTAVNGSSVPPRGAGPPMRIKPGDTLKLGQVELTFTDARALQEFVLQAAG